MKVTKTKIPRTMGEKTRMSICPLRNLRASVTAAVKQDTSLHRVEIRINQKKSGLLIRLRVMHRQQDLPMQVLWDLFQDRRRRCRHQARSESSGSQSGWAGAHIQLQFHQQAFQMRDWILLDNQSSVTVFCNKDMVSKH